MDSNVRASLRGLKVVSFESRRAVEMAELIRRYGGEPIAAPSMREIPLTENRAALELLPQIEAGRVDILILMTGVGTRILNQILLTQYAQDRIVAALKSIRLVARGPKPVGVLKELRLQAAATIPEPNTWREILSVLDSVFAVAGKRIAIQEYGMPNPDLNAALAHRGAAVTPVPIYRWALPEDITPLRDTIRKIINGEVDVALFTNGAQVDHMFSVAAQDGLDAVLRTAFPRLVIGSVGPVCTQVLQQFALKPDLEPRHPRMGSLIAEVAATASRILVAKRGI
ncbi:MAG: uroporphyrinogen-III synthase [Candidatus Binatia bacterium]